MTEDERDMGKGKIKAACMAAVKELFHVRVSVEIATGGTGADRTTYQGRRSLYHWF